MKRYPLETPGGTQEFAFIYESDLYRIPIALRLLFPQFMDDTKPAERELAMFMNRILLSKCEEVWVYAPRISPGMKQEACWARHLDIPLRFLDSDFREIQP